MPIYEYECTQCGKIDEVIQKFSEKPLKKCKRCSGKLQKLISHSSFHLKGTGWYVTDYAGKPRDTSPPPPKQEAKASSADTGQKQDNKKTKKPADKTS
ncbi:FmdB family zinc ribbon protein [Thermodesulfobacteriota bacterium]